MPLPEHLGGFAAAAVLIAVMPGPDFVLITRNTVRGGRRAGLGTAAGSVVGLTGWAALSAAGLAVLVTAHPEVLRALRLAGAAYLLYLGISALLGLWRAHRARPGSGVAEPDAGPGAARGGTPFWQGLLNNAVNPKAPAFFVTVVPQFVSHPEAGAAQTALLGAVLIAVAVVWWCVYIFGIGALSAFMRRRRVRQGIELSGGVALTAFGLALALAA